MTRHLWANKYQQLLCLRIVCDHWALSPLPQPARRLCSGGNSPRPQQHSCIALKSSAASAHGSNCRGCHFQLFHGRFGPSVCRESTSFKLLCCQEYLRTTAPLSPVLLSLISAGEAPKITSVGETVFLGWPLFLERWEVLRSNCRTCVWLFVTRELPFFFFFKSTCEGLLRTECLLPAISYLQQHLCRC